MYIQSCENVSQCALGKRSMYVCCTCKGKECQVGVDYIEEL